jgi:hypothetical protein
MSDRGFLFLFSLLMIVGGLGAGGWLLASGQAATVDGLFLLLTALLIAAAFALYLVFLIRRAMSAVSAPVVEKAKAGAVAASARPAALRS